LQDLRAKIAGPSGRHGTLLVLGNEEYGLPEKILQNCLVRLRIPGTGRLDSLNVSAAAAVIMNELFNC
jgi:tRNA G18 (ribose-2'-O)-methylase SpoU